MKFNWKSAFISTLFTLGFTFLYFLWIVFEIYFIAGDNPLIAILLGIIPTIIILFIHFGVEGE
jgi:apolipoprotein N-acyltransferase